MTRTRKIKRKETAEDIASDVWNFVLTKHPEIAKGIVDTINEEENEKTISSNDNELGMSDID